MTKPIAHDGSTSSLLAGLTQSTEQSIENLEGPKTTAQDLDAKIAEMEQQITEASKITDKARRDDRMRILTASIDQLRQEDEVEKRDFAEAVMGLDALMNSIGGDFQKLMEPSAQEKFLVSNAETELRNAELQVAAAENKWSIFGIRARARTAANNRHEAAKIGLANAQAQAAKMARERLMSADIESSMQQFMLMVDKTLKIMKSRHTTTAGQLKIIKARKDQAFTIKEQAASALEKLDQNLNAAEAELAAAEEDLATKINGSEDYVAQEKIVSGIKVKVEEIRGNRNTAHAVFLSKERFVSELEVHEVATRRTFDTQKVWIAKLTSDSEERQVTFVSRVEQMKAMADLEVIGHQDQVGTRLDVSNTSYMATSSAIADRARMKMLEGHPDQVKVLEGIRAAQAEHIAQIRERESALLQEFKARWGIDPFTGSFLHQQRQTGEEAPGAVA